MSVPKPARFWIGVAAWTLRPVANILMRKEWLGLEKLPKGQGFILCPTHCTEIDPIVVGHMLYNQNIMPHFMAKDGLFRTPLVGTVLRGARQIPVQRAGATAGRSLELAKEVLDEGGAIIVYPEGTLTRDPDLWPMRGHTGAARLALMTGAPVVPVAHWGAQEAFPRYAKRVHIFPRKTVRVLIGDTVDLSRFKDSPLDKATLAAATTVILDDMTALLAQLRGEEPPAVRWDPKAHAQKSHGRDVTRGRAVAAATLDSGADDGGTGVGAQPAVGASSDGGTGVGAQPAVGASPDGETFSATPATRHTPDTPATTEVVKPAGDAS